MTYPLEPFESVKQNYLFWLQKFFTHKMTTLSNRHIHDKEAFTKSLDSIKSAQNLGEFERAIKSARNCGMIGLNTYANPLFKLGEYLVSTDSISSLREIDEVFLSEFITIATARLSNATKRNFRIVLIGFFGFVDKHNEDENGKSHILNIELKSLSGTRGKSGQKLPTFLKEEELEKFLKAIDEAPISAVSEGVQARDRLIVKLIVYTGIRVSEAINLEVNKVLPDGEIYLLNIQGKGDKQRVVMIKKAHIDSLLKEWLGYRSLIESQKATKKEKIQGNLLFCNQKGKPLSQPYIYGIVRNMLLYIGIRKEKMGAHLLRHSFATLLYQKHKDLVLVQEALGHADLNTSRIYTHFDKDRLRKAASLMDNLTK